MVENHKNEIMKSQKDIIRQASLFTMGGLVDPRFMDQNNAMATQAAMQLRWNVRGKWIETFFTARKNNKPASL
jgi:hypothetical protein